MEGTERAGSTDELQNALNNAAQNGHLDIVKGMISKGAEVNKRSDAWTALQLAAQSGHLDVTKYLIGQGAEVNMANTHGWTALHIAAQTGRLDVTKYLISQGAEVDKSLNDSWTALHLAAQNGHVNVVKELISKGAEVNKGRNSGWTALHSAALNGHFDIVQELISEGADVRKIDSDGWTALSSAAQNGHLDIVKELISKGAEVNEGKNTDWPALLRAASNGHIDVIRELISKGADVNMENGDGYTALHSAARNGHLDIVQELISKGADVRKIDGDGSTALDSAAQYGNLDVVKKLISKGAEVNEGKSGWPVLLRAAENGHLDVAKFLIRQGAEVNQGNNDGQTALHLAAQNGHLDVVKDLISRGAEVNKRKDNGRIAIQSAAHNGHLEVVRYLISQGAEVHHGDNDGCTAFHLAAQNDHLDVAKELISKGAEVNKKRDNGRIALQGAAQNGHLEVTRYLISQGAEVNHGDNYGCTALHLAAHSGHLDVTKHLISKRAAVKKRDEDGWTTLHFAAKNGHHDVLKYLISQGAKVNEADNDGRTALHLASLNGHLDFTKELIHKGAEVNKGKNDGWTALHSAALNGHCDVVKELISGGANIHKGDDNGWTALHCAAESGHLDIIKELIHKGAAVDLGKNDGWTALHSGAQSGHLDIVKELISAGGDVKKITDYSWTALHSAAKNGHLEVTKYLIGQGAEVNKGDNDGQTALHYAAQNCHLDIVKELVSVEGEIEKGDNDGWTALHLAAQKGHLDVTKYLISQGADVNKGDNSGWTALRTASRNGHQDVTKYLISQGGDVKKDDDDGWTALHGAAQNGHLDVVKELIHKGAEVDKGSNDGWMALHLAAQNGHLDVVKELISQGSEVNKGDDEGWTALHGAAQNGHLDVIKELISKGADVNKSRNDGWTALQSAAQIGHLEITKYLISHGADVQHVCKNGWSVLLGAVENGYADVARYLVSQGAEVKKTSRKRFTLLHSAAGNGHLDVTKYLISQEVEVNGSSDYGWTALHSAAVGGHLDVTKYLICQGADVNLSNRCGWTALHLAAMEGYVDVTNYLISQGADVNKVTDKGWSALYIAAVEGHVSVTNALLSQDAGLEETNTIYWTKLQSAVERGDLEVTKDLVSQSRVELDKTGSFGWTALHIAAREGHSDITKYLLSQGADVNSSNAFGKCALHNAAKKGHMDVLECLVSEGANVSKGNVFGVNALHYASGKGHLGMVKHLIGHGGEVDTCDEDGTTALHFALCAGHLDVIKYLLSQGAALSKRSHGDVALQFDEQYGHYDALQCVQTVGEDCTDSGLLDRYTVFKGAAEQELGRSKYEDANEEKTALGGMTILYMPLMTFELDFQDLLSIQESRTVARTSLQYATDGGHLRVVQYLVQRGADVNESNNVGWTALHFAAQSGRCNIAEYLLDQGAEVNKGSDDDITALHVAAFVGHLDIIYLLLSRGAELNGKTKQKGSTALHVGTQNGHLSITTCLLTQGADVNVTDNSGWSPLHIAAQNGHSDIAKSLLLQGANVGKVTRKGSTALHLSAANGHADVTKCLVDHGAEVNKSKPHGQSASHLPAEQDQLNRTSLDTRCGEGQKHSYSSPPSGHADTEQLAEHEKAVGQTTEKGCTAVHLATQRGHTSVIETLVSSGADLNIPSIDGQTCLHEAIILSTRKDSKVETTAALQKISADFYENELSPRKALVFFLLDHGAKPDVKDNRGNLPVHYARDEIVRQMIFSRSPGIDLIRTYRAEEALDPVVNAVSAQVGCKGKELELEHHGISMVIPSGAVEENSAVKITLTLVRDLPSVDIQDDESMAAFGIRCDPPNTIFHQPVKIRIPHSTLVTNPDKVSPDIISHVWDTRKGLPRISRTRSSKASDKWPYCKVHERHLELFIDYCAEWWVLVPLEQQVVQLQLKCTPYVPDRIERSQEFDVHLHVHADIPGIDMEVRKEEEQQSYHMAHRSFPITIEAKSGDVSVTSDCEDKIAQTKVLSLKDIHSQMRHNIVLTMTPSQDNTEFSVITITVTQAGRLGTSRSLAFIIRYADESASEVSGENSSFNRAVEEVSHSDLPDIDIITIAQMMTVNQFYDLGVALGFTIRQLDVIEYRRFRDRQQAIYDMLVTWRKRQASGPEAKETFLSLMKSLDSPAELKEVLALTGEVPDKTLLAFAHQIKSEKFFEIGKKLGFNRMELEHIQHRTFSNRKDANIQMLSSWKASQPPGPEAIETLKRVWESIQTASKSRKSEDEESLPEKEPTVPKAVKRPPPRKRTDADFVEIIRTTDSDQDLDIKDVDKSGGVPSTEELCNVAVHVKTLPLAWELGKALRLDDNLIAGFVEPPDSTALAKIARRLIDDWWNGLDKTDRDDEVTNLLHEYDIHNNEIDDCREELSKKICSMADLLQLAPHLNCSASDIMHDMCKTVTLPVYEVRRVILHMLREWLSGGGTRGRLLEIVQAFRFNDAAESIAATIKDDPGCVEFISSTILDHRGGVVELDELGIRVSIPAGALHRGMRSVVTIRVPDHARIPLREGEVLVGPAVECSLTQELLKPASVVLPHCIHPKKCKDGTGLILYTKTGLGTFARRKFLSHSSKGFHISKGKIEFLTSHVQLWAVSSTNVQHIQFRCVAFQPLYMPASRKPTLRVYVFHPYRRHLKNIERAEEKMPEPFCPVMDATKFSVGSTTLDLTLCFNDGFTESKRNLPIGNLLKDEESALSFELEFSPFEEGEKNIHLTIQQGTSTLLERDFTTSIEVEPDYGVDLTDEQGRQHYASDKLLGTLTTILHTPKDAQGLGYQLGFTHSALETYLNRPDATFNCVSRSGFVEMLRDWRRRVRPRDQADRLRTAMKDAGLGYAADVFLHGRESLVKFAQLRKALQDRI